MLGNNMKFDVERFLVFDFEFPILNYQCHAVYYRSAVPTNYPLLLVNWSRSEKLEISHCQLRTKFNRSTIVSNYNGLQLYNAELPLLGSNIEKGYGLGKSTIPITVLNGKPYLSIAKSF